MHTPHGDIRVFLSGVGLTPTEISLYIAGLQYGPQSGAALARHTGIKRTTAHSALASLTQKGFAGAHQHAGTGYYSMKNPNLIEKEFIQKIDDLKKQRLDFINLLPLFDPLLSTSSSTTEVTSYTGTDGVKTVIDTALYCASRQWKIIAPERNFISEGSKEYSDYFIKTRKQRGLRAKSLWEPNFVKKRKFDETALEFRNPRVLPKKLEGRFKNMLIIFDASVAFISSSKEATAVLIRSTEIHDTLELFFDGLWESARPIPERNLSN